jgi:hypothetical protein
LSSLYALPVWSVVLAAFICLCSVARFQQASVTDDSWDPEIFVENAIGKPTQRVDYGLEKDGNGTIYRVKKIKMKGTFFQQMDMVEFPFDIQVQQAFLMRLHIWKWLITCKCLPPLSGAG